MSEREQLFLVPKNVRQVGSQSGERWVYIEDYVISFVEYLGKCAGEQPKAAVLLGEHQADKERRITVVHGAVEIKQLEMQKSTCFSKETWNEIYREIEEYFKGKQIVGWVITKAGLQMEVSKQLEKLHEENFAGKDKLLFLYDALEREQRVFAFNGSTLEMESGFFIYYDKNEDMQEYMLQKKGNVEREKVNDKAILEVKRRLSAMEEKQKKQRKYKKYARSIGTLGGVALLAALLQMDTVRVGVAETFAGLTETSGVATVKNTDYAENKPEATEDLLEEMPAQISIPHEEVENSQDTKLIEDEAAKATAEPEQNQYYTIQPGDTLVSICMSQFQSLDNMEEIVRINKITDQNRIVAGKKIKLWE